MLDQRRYRRKIRKMYRQAVKAGLTDLGVRMRNETVLRLAPKETIVEDEPVLVADAQSLNSSTGTGLGRWGWMILTSERVIWAAYPERGRKEARFGDLDLMFSQDDRDTFRWVEERERYGWGPKQTVVSVTLGFSEKSDIRSALHGSVNDERHKADDS
jgi:hypothetical protein